MRYFVSCMVFGLALFLMSCSLADEENPFGDMDSGQICMATDGTWEEGICYCPEGKVYREEIDLKPPKHGNCVRCSEAYLIDSDVLEEKYEMKDRCYGILSRRETDASYCDRIIAKGKKDQCYSNIVLDTKNHSICHMMDSEDNVYQCLKEGLGELVPLEYCLELDEHRPMCIFEHVRLKGNLSYCDHIKQHGFYKDACIIREVEATKNYELCNQLTIQSKESCIEILEYV